MKRGGYWKGSGGKAHAKGKAIGHGKKGGGAVPATGKAAAAGLAHRPRL